MYINIAHMGTYWVHSPSLCVMYAPPLNVLFANTLHTNTLLCTLTAWMLADTRNAQTAPTRTGPPSQTLLVQQRRPWLGSLAVAPAPLSPRLAKPTAPATRPLRNASLYIYISKHIYIYIYIHVYI